MYDARSVRRGLPRWSVEQLSGGGRHRLYRATVTAVFVLDDHDERVVVPPAARDRPARGGAG